MVQDAVAGSKGEGSDTSVAEGRVESLKFRNPCITAKGEPRAVVPFRGYETVWINTGTLCNLTCHNCYIESSPRNDRLVFLTRAEVRLVLDDAMGLAKPPAEIGFTGGEPFMNPDIIGMLEDSLARGFRDLVLTNGMKPMQRLKEPLLDLNRRWGARLRVRVSLDHYERSGHEKLRGPRTWRPTLEGLLWLAANDFDVTVAGRTIWGESEATMRAGYAALFAQLGIAIDTDDPSQLTMFPEMEERDDVPEISASCWGILGKSPDSVMCARSRMVVKRKGADRLTVLSCTLIPYSEAFEMGSSLAEAQRAVSLNHRHCARFCVLGGGSCSPHK